MTKSELKTPVDIVREFIEAFDGNRDQEFCRTLIREEVKEAQEAAEHLLKEICDVIYVMAYARVCGLDIEADREIKPLLENAPMLLDSIPPEIIAEAFIRVHESNMSKLGDDGKPVRREDGKILKGPNYQPPYLGDLV